MQKIWKIDKYKEENKDDLTVHHTEVISANVLAFFRPVFSELHICFSFHAQPYCKCPHIPVRIYNVCNHKPCVGGVLILLHLHALIRRHCLQSPPSARLPPFRVGYLVAESLQSSGKFLMTNPRCTIAKSKIIITNLSCILFSSHIFQN